MLAAACKKSLLAIEFHEGEVELHSRQIFEFIISAYLGVEPQLKEVNAGVGRSINTERPRKRFQYPTVVHSSMHAIVAIAGEFSLCVSNELVHPGYHFELRMQHRLASAITMAFVR